MATATIVCKQCNFENEPERVYCHNCGAKLDRSLLPPEATKREDPMIVQERVRRIIKPRNNAGGRGLRNLIFSVALAAILAGIIAAITPPDNVPEVSKEAALEAPIVTDDIDGLLKQPAPYRLTYTEDQVNAFLQSSVRSKKDGNTGLIPLKFERSFVRINDGNIQIGYVQSIFGFPIYASTVRTVILANGALETHPIAGTLGRLPISATVMPYFEVMFNPLWKVLDRDRALIAQLGTISFRKKAVDLVSKGAAAH